MPAYIVIFIMISLLLPRFAYSQAFKLTEDQQPNFNNLANFNAKDLCQVAEPTKAYLLKGSQYDDFANHSGEDALQANFTLKKVADTLDYICQIQKQDEELKQASRLQDPVFLKQNFKFHQWQADLNTALSYAKKSTSKVKTRLLSHIPKDKILLTKYYTKKLKASEVQTQEYNQALYALPYDETKLSRQQAEQNKHKLTRYKYTRQDIINGVLLTQNLAKPLIWLTEEALHDVLLQGTGVLNVDGQIRYFNVHRNNGISYDYNLGKRQQARYWYFSEVPGIMGYGKNKADKIPLKAHVSFAGNVAQLGLGKLILVNYQTKIKNSNKPKTTIKPELTKLSKKPDNTLIDTHYSELISQIINTKTAFSPREKKEQQINYPKPPLRFYDQQNSNELTNKENNEWRLGILADQGGAFDGNLFQLDLLVDSYYGWSDYYAKNKHINDYAKTWILLKK